MKAIRYAVAVVLVATLARAETAPMANARAGRMAIGTESGNTWTGADSDHPLPISPAPRCGTTHLKTVRTAPSGSNVSVTLTGMCSSGTCYGCSVDNIDATNACAVAFNASDASAGRILYSVANPTLENSFGSWAYESSVASIRVATSGISEPEGRIIGACDLQVTCCGL